MGILDRFRRKPAKLPEVSWGPCCFCAQEIEPTDVDPCSVRVETVRGRWQVWFCHAECFRERITTDAPMDLSPEHF
jgi:hypothetical protein